jgi:uncharacterized protein YbjT (DUF2867 family)
MMLAVQGAAGRRGGLLCRLLRGVPPHEVHET